ncbi:hypothetical protein CERSUDRAFT_101570 [Gelatoporia subvermispora B]|uniref:Uncharacterized protein n=1 Tax=Ceriporiopsis subvermispora (strain B) TaxID=914234 RepID=M2QUX1_CERS8|nr:hypothetical protein CERSUDRAFT_101570 [Gelatoporia subvermispora B]
MSRLRVRMREALVSDTLWTYKACAGELATRLALAFPGSILLVLLCTLGRTSRWHGKADAQVRHGEFTRPSHGAAGRCCDDPRDASLAQRHTRGAHSRPRRQTIQPPTPPHRLAHAEENLAAASVSALLCSALLLLPAYLGLNFCLTAESGRVRAALDAGQAR